MGFKIWEDTQELKKKHHQQNKNFDWVKKKFNIRYCDDWLIFFRSEKCITYICFHRKMRPIYMYIYMQ